MTVTFRRDGQASEAEWHNADGSIVRLVYVYDDAGRLVEERSRKDDGTRWGAIYSYDSMGRQAGKETISDGRHQRTEVREYDAAGRQKTAIFLPTDLFEGSIGIATEGLEGDEVSFHDANGQLIRRVLFSRDAEGRALSEVIYLGAADLERGGKEVSLEERAEILAALKAAFADDVFCRTVFKYDARGRLLERTMSMGALSEERWNWEYEDRDDPVAETMKSWENGVEHREREQRNRYDYQYDSQGNWTERVVSCRTASQEDFRRSIV